MITYSWPRKKKHPERETTNNPNEKVAVLPDLLIIKARVPELLMMTVKMVMWPMMLMRKSKMSQSMRFWEKCDTLV